jgi:hypothetical protein
MTLILCDRGGDDLLLSGSLLGGSLSDRSGSGGRGRSSLGNALTLTSRTLRASGASGALGASGACGTSGTSWTNTTSTTSASIINQLENETVETSLIETGALEFIFDFFA